MWIRTWLLIGALLSSLNVSAKEWLIDVRTAEEYSAEHVPGATHIDYQQVVPEVTKLGSASKSQFSFIVARVVELRLRDKR